MTDGLEKNGFVRFVHQVSEAFAWVSGISLFAMAFLTFVDVIFRYFINKPIKGSQEIVELLMVLTLYFGLASATRHRRHICVDAVVNLLKLRSQYVVYGIGSLLCVLVSGPAALKMMERGFKILGQSNMATGTLFIPLAPFYLLAALACLVLTLEFLFDGILRFIEAAEMGAPKGKGADASKEAV